MRSKIRCAIYTRKSSDEGLDQAFNSLDAQRDACAAYVASQTHEGWVLAKNRLMIVGSRAARSSAPLCKPCSPRSTLAASAWSLCIRSTA